MKRTIGRAFGLTLDVGFACPGLPTLDAAPGVRLDLASRPDLVAGFPATAGWFATDAELGYLWRAEGYGDFRVTADGRWVGCAPAPGPAWMWQRYLVGQVLPLVALLHGLEVFHASLVARDGTGIAFFGASGSGKSSLAAGLALRGARFMADDVIAVERCAGQPVAHCGFGLTSMRHRVAEGMGVAALERLGAPIGSDDEAVRVSVPVATDPVPVTTIYFLERSDQVRRPAIEAVEPIDPRLLLASSYNFTIRTAERLTRHLDVCSRLARSAAVFRISVPSDRSPFELAPMVDAHRASTAA